jgi:beta-lactamase class A
MQRFLAVLFIILACAAPVVAEQITPKAALERLWTSDKVNAEWFAASFLAQVPAAQVQSIIDQYKGQLGVYQSVRADGSNFMTEFAKGSVPSQIHLDNDGRIDGLFFKVAVPKKKDLGAALDRFKSLPGSVSVVIKEGERDKGAINADKSLAVGSTFKLAVLSALKKQVDANRQSWREIVTLRSYHKSLPSGILPEWPEGAPLTLYTVAALMISQSDNTAADIVARLAGRIAVEAESPARNRPFLTTREAFQLKDPKNADLLATWRKGDINERRALLQVLSKRPLPAADIFGGSPVAPDVEWFFTTRELCTLMVGVASLPLMTINPGVADPKRFARVAYKGGSEPGVLNLTTQVITKDGKTYCVSATWNDTKALDEKQFFLMYGDLLNNL